MLLRHLLAPLGPVFLGLMLLAGAAGPSVAQTLIVPSLDTGRDMVLSPLTDAAAQADGEMRAPAAVIDRLHDALLVAMQNADSLGFDGRYAALEPVLRDSFDFSAMARFAVGPTFWPDLSASQRQAVVGLFSEMSISTYAARFSGYSGQSFRVTEEADAGRGRLIVRSQLVRPDDGPVGFDYVLIQDEETGWRIIDVLLNGQVSELARQRAEYTAVLRRGGFDGLVAALEEAIERRRQG